MSKNGSAGDLPGSRKTQAGVRQTVYESVAANIGNRREPCGKNPLSWGHQSGRIEVDNKTVQSSHTATIGGGEPFKKKRKNYRKIPLRKVLLVTQRHVVG